MFEKKLKKACGFVVNCVIYFEFFFRSSSFLVDFNKNRHIKDSLSQLLHLHLLQSSIATIFLMIYFSKYNCMHRPNRWKCAVNLQSKYATFFSQCCERHCVSSNASQHSNIQTYCKGKYRSFKWHFILNDHWLCV